MTKYLDCSAVIEGEEVRLAIVNRHESDSFVVAIHFGPRCELGNSKVKVHEIWSKDLGDRNGFEETKVKTAESEVELKEGGMYSVKEHSFQGA